VYGVENADLEPLVHVVVAVERDAGVEAWIFFDGEEEGGSVGEEGSTWSKVRLGIRNCEKRREGRVQMALHGEVLIDGTR